MPPPLGYRHARLLDATRELVGTIGYAATTIERICSTANVSTRHFYLQYASKEAALVDLYDSLTRESLRKVLASWQETEGRPISERVSAALMAYLGPMFSDPQIARIAFVEVIGVSPRLEQIRLAYRESLIAFIQQEGSAAAARGEAADRDKLRLGNRIAISAGSGVCRVQGQPHERQAIAHVAKDGRDLVPDKVIPDREVAAEHQSGREQEHVQRSSARIPCRRRQAPGCEGALSW